MGLDASNGGAGMGAYTLPAVVGSVAGTVWVRARFTHGHRTGIRGWRRTETRPREILGRKCGLGN